MGSLQDVFLPLLVWLFFLCLIGFFALMYRWARKRKGAALAFGFMVQMFLPDPKVEQTIQCVTEVKQEKKDKASASEKDEPEEV